jgi:DNA polymerase-3 subunit epsilon
VKLDKILFIDTETGGIDPLKYSLLSVGLAVWQNFKIIDSVEILINDGILNVTPKALEINKIDLKEHKKRALTPIEAIKQIDTFLNRHFDKSEKINLAGHNVNFDVNFFKAFLNKYGYSFEGRFSHRFVDTSSILFYLYLSGQMQEKAISSDAAFNLFHIKVDKRHSALGDTIATAKLFTILLRLINKKVKLKDMITDDLTLFGNVAR